MKLTSLTAISPVDGRYGEKSAELREVFSEYGLIRYRLLVEIEWLKALSNCEQLKEIPAFDRETIQSLDQIINDFTEKDALRVKQIEATTNHDVKAVEYFLREKVVSIKKLDEVNEFIHFACTSEDINNLSHALMLKDARSRFLIPCLEHVIHEISALASAYAAQPMLSRTHGQAATPTTMGKEMSVFAFRLKRQFEQFKTCHILAKFNGAVGNYNAHISACPEINWPEFNREFVEGLGVEWNSHTTQIEPHDYMAEYFHLLIRINTILIDFVRDIWAYISIGYFKQKTVSGEIGSSTMPHKVNPIDFENAEGNLGIANSLLAFMAEKLPISRWQRDLTDSTVIRNSGTAIAHTILAINSCLKGINKLEIDQDILERDLEESWEVLAEPIQTVMRRYAVAEAYEKLKALTRGQAVNRDRVHAFIKDLDIPEQEKTRLLELTPRTYIGDAVNLANSDK